MIAYSHDVGQSVVVEVGYISGENIAHVELRRVALRVDKLRFELLERTVSVAEEYSLTAHVVHERLIVVCPSGCLESHDVHYSVLIHVAGRE